MSDSPNWSNDRPETRRSLASGPSERGVDHREDARALPTHQKKESGRFWSRASERSNRQPRDPSIRDIQSESRSPILDLSNRWSLEIGPGAVGGPARAPESADHEAAGKSRSVDRCLQASSGAPARAGEGRPMELFPRLTAAPRARHGPAHGRGLLGRPVGPGPTGSAGLLQTIAGHQLGRNQPTAFSPPERSCSEPPRPS